MCTPAAGCIDIRHIFGFLFDIFRILDFIGTYLRFCFEFFDQIQKFYNSRLPHFTARSSFHFFYILFYFLQSLAFYKLLNICRFQHKIARHTVIKMPFSYKLPDNALLISQTVNLRLSKVPYVLCQYLPSFLSYYYILLGGDIPPPPSWPRNGELVFNSPMISLKTETLAQSATMANVNSTLLVHGSSNKSASKY